MPTVGFLAVDNNFHKGLFFIVITLLSYWFLLLSFYCVVRVLYLRTAVLCLFCVTFTNGRFAVKLAR